MHRRTTRAQLCAFPSIVSHDNYFRHRSESYHIESHHFRFQNAVSFQGNLSGWKTKQVHHVAHMFSNAISYQGGQDLAGWETSEFRDLSAMFHHAIRFQGNVSAWNTSNAVEMDEMFSSAVQFNGDLSRWDTSQVITMVRFSVCECVVNLWLGRISTGCLILNAIYIYIYFAPFYRPKCFEMQPCSPDKAQRVESKHGMCRRSETSMGKFSCYQVCIGGRVAGLAMILTLAIMSCIWLMSVLFLSLHCIQYPI